MCACRSAKHAWRRRRRGFTIETRGVGWVDVFWSQMTSKVDWYYDVMTGVIKSFVFGIAVSCIATFEGFVERELKSGALEPVLEEWLQPFSGAFLYYPSRRHMPAPLRAFVDFIKRRTQPDIASAALPG